MRQRLALATPVALALAAFWGSGVRPAAGEDAKPGTIVTVAGTGEAGYSGDGGPATQAQLDWPSGLAVDGSGNVYVADFYNNRVRKVSADGTIKTVAGTGQAGFSGDGGNAIDAELHGPWRVVVDTAGELLITDAHNHRVRKITPDGIISTVAGSGPVEDPSFTSGIPQNGGFSGDGGPATDARLNGPNGLAVDAAGNLFIGDSNNYRVRKVDSATGIITTVAGNGQERSSGDSGPATAAGMYPFDIVVDAAGVLFIADNPVFSDLSIARVRKVTPDGMITTVAGTGQPGFTGDGGPATAAHLSHPDALALDSTGNLFISDWDNYRVRRVDAVTGTITTVAGRGRRMYAGDGGLAVGTGLRGPEGLAIDAAGNLLISDSGYYHEGDGLPDNERVLKVTGAAAPGLLAGMVLPR